MKHHSTLLSLVAATVLFTACGEETQKVVEEINTTKVAEAVKKDTVHAVETAKVVVAEKAVEAAEAVKEKAEALKESATPEAPAAYAKCKACHGADGKTKALGKSAVIAGQDKAALIESLKAYQAGTKNVAGMGSLMQGQVATMSDEEIEAVAEYLSQI